MLLTSPQFAAYITEENSGMDVSREIEATIALVGPSATEEVWLDSLGEVYDAMKEERK